MTKSRYPRIFERLYGRPLMLLPDKAYAIERVFQQHVVGMSTEALVREAYRDDAPSSAQADAGYEVTAGGVALLPIVGTLVQRSSFMDALSGITSYAEVGAAFDRAEADPKVRGILLEVDSGGGEVNGCFDLVDQIAASTKPVWCVANEAAYSAAYAIASAADRIVMPRTAGVGSIGVIALHVDQSVRDQKQGLTYTPIMAGEKKFDGNSHAPLPDGVRAAIQDDIDRLYQIFVSTVAGNRGITAESVIATQADVFHPAAAIDLGLADSIGTLDDAINEFEDFLKRAAEQAQVQSVGIAASPMSTAAAAIGVRLPVLATLRTEVAPDARKTGAAVGAGLERARIGAILSSEAAKRRGELARHLALETGMGADAAIALMTTAPRQATPMAAAQVAAAVLDDGPGDAEISEATKVAIRIASAGGRRLPGLP